MKCCVNLKPILYYGAKTLRFCKLNGVKIARIVHLIHRKTELIIINYVSIFARYL
jgi:hypothetical protein